MDRLAFVQGRKNQNYLAQHVIHVHYRYFISFYRTLQDTGVLIGQGQLDWQIPQCFLTRWLLLNVCPSV